MDIFDSNLYGMDIFDMYLIGEMDYINWDFSGTHLDKRLKENCITLEYIKYMIFNEDPTFFIKSGGTRHQVFFKSPKSKDYDEIKVIFDCEGNTIEVVSVMPDNSIGTNKQQTMFYTDDMKKQKKLIARAHGK